MAIVKIIYNLKSRALFQMELTKSGLLLPPGGESAIPLHLFILLPSMVHENFFQIKSAKLPKSCLDRYLLLDGYNR
jgi:hypothetical protein